MNKLKKIGSRIAAGLKEHAGTLVMALLGSLIVSSAVLASDVYAPNGFALTSAATVQTSCTDGGGGIGVINTTQVCLPPTIAEAETLSALLSLTGAGTALAVTNNATIGGTLGVTGTTTLGTAAVTTFSGTPNFSGTPTFAAGAGLGTGTYSGAATFSGADSFSSTLGVTGLLTTAAITSSGLHTISSTTPINFTADASTGATGFGITAAGTGLLTTTTPELGLIAHNATAGTNGCPDTGTGSTNLMFQIANSANTAHDFEINCKGNVAIGGVSATVNQLNVATNVSLTSAANGQGQLDTGAAALIAGALGAGAISLGGGGVLGTDVNCGTTPISTSAKAATMTNGLSCLIQVVAADVAGPFTINYIHAFNSKPQCQVTMAVNTNAVTVKSCLAGLSSAVVTLSASVATNDQFQITFTGGK